MNWFKIEDKEDQLKVFWQEIDNNFGDLLELCRKYHPNYTQPYKVPEHMILAEKACESVRNEIRSKSDNEYPIRNMEIARSDRDVVKLQSIANEIWFGMPESPSIRKEKGFFLLCDICSDAPIVEE